MNKRRDILLVDDHPIIVVAVKALLESRGDRYDLRCAVSQSAALEAVAERAPEVAIVDIELPDGDGLSLIREIHALAPECRVLVFTMQDELKYGPRALRAGAKGYLMKGERVNRLFEALEAVEAGRSYCSSELADAVMSSLGSGGKSGGVDGLSDREFEIFRLLGEGRSGKAVASLLRISPKTVDSHRENMKRKLGCESTLELAFFARDWVARQRNDAC